MKIAHFGVKPWEVEYLKNNLNTQQEQLFFEQDNIPNDLESMADIQVLSVFIHTNLGKNILEKLPNLDLILTRSTGFDHIDIEYAKENNIQVYNVPGYGSNTVAEHTFALLLSISKQIFNQANRSKEFNFRFEDNLGFDLHSKTIGVIGAGKIGKNTIQIARGFDMKAIAFDIYKDEFAAEVAGFRYVEIEEILATSDILTLHTPLNDFTKNILSRENLLKLKPGAVFLNTSRGGLISNENLLFALENGIFAYAGLDAIEGEENLFKGLVDPTQQKILNHPKVLYTPHSAFYTKEAVTRIIQTTIDNYNNFQSHNSNNKVT
ncbi:MAG: NAD(P)-dependent oxidoreductase [Patescibacteria group bacterium]